MEESKRQRVALVSVTEKTDPDIAEFVRQCQALGDWHIIGSAGTCRHLAAAGIQAQDISDMITQGVVQEFVNAGVAFREAKGDGSDLTIKEVVRRLDADPIFGHRVVSLSRQKSAALLARAVDDDLAELAKLGVPFIDMVVCDFYALKRAIEAEGATTESVVEATDIGGPTMVSEGAKGRRIVICDPADRAMVIDEMREHDGEITEGTRNALCAKADGVVAEYRLDGARFHSGGVIDGVVGRRFWTLDKGESGGQSPAYLYSSPAAATDPLAWRNFVWVSGTPGYVNLADANRVKQTMCKSTAAFRLNFDGKAPHQVLWAKHGNLCGMGVDFEDPLVAVIRAALGDSIAGMGGEVMLNFPVTDEIGEALFEVPKEHQHRVGRKNWGADIIMAPAFSDAAVDLLGKRAKRKLLVNPALSDPVVPSHEWVIAMLSPNEFLKQRAPYFVFNAEEVEEWIGSRPTQQDLVDMIIAWVSAWYADSNTASLANNSMLIALGPGNQDRIWCFAEAIRKAKRSRQDIKGAKFGSDGFLPYPERSAVNRPLEGAQLCRRAGCSGGVVPADGQNLAATKEFFRRAGMQVAFVPREHRGFMYHA